MAGHRKNTTIVSRGIQINSGENRLKISFNKEGIPEIVMTDGISTLNFIATEQQAEAIRLAFWDNYRRLNIWKTKAQRKEERRQEALKLMTPKDIERMEKLMMNYPDTDMSYLLDSYPCFIPEFPEL
jgi:hypothetical protein